MFDLHLQRISRELDSSWRMALVRQQTAKHDVWKRQVQAHYYQQQHPHNISRLHSTLALRLV
jgi:hypothetical protein